MAPGVPLPYRPRARSPGGAKDRLPPRRVRWLVFRASMSGVRALAATALCVALALGGASGCATRPVNRPVLRSLELRGARQVDPATLLDGLATKATSSVLGLVLQYETYDRFVLERDLKRIERAYRARGFYDARVQAGRVERIGRNEVAVEVLLDEGAPTLIDEVRVERQGELDGPGGLALGQAQTVRRGERFDEASLAAMQQAMRKALTDQGYAHAAITGGFRPDDLVATDGRLRVLAPGEVDSDPQTGEDVERRQAEKTAEDETRLSVRLDPVRHEADVYLRATPGPLCVFGPIRIEGLAGLPEGQVRAALGVVPGERYSTAKLESGRRALLELGVFSSVEYVIDLDDTGAEVPVLFKVAPAPLRTVAFGGGLQADVLQTDVHGVASFDHQNFLGGLRRLTVQVRPGVVLFPTNLQNLLPPSRVLPQVQSRIELRQPQLFEARTRGTLRTELGIYPFLLPARNQAEVPDVVVGYREVRQAAGLDRTFLDGKLALSAFYNVQLSYPFSYLGPLDEGIRRVLVSYISLVQAIDLRDSPVQPRRGVYLANEVQLAGAPTDWIFQSDARDIKIQPDVRFYAPVGRRVTLATRASVGFLVPRSYGATLGQGSPDPTSDPLGALAFESSRNRDLQLLFFRAFFSGGPTSNRGYALRGVGPRGIAPFRLGGTTTLRDCVGRAPGGAGVSGAAAQVAKLPGVDPQVCSVPLGGLSLWEWSGELRWQVTERLGTLVFMDAGDVTRDRLALRLLFPHVSVGTGLRVNTPVGPVRLDVGYAVPGLQRIGGDLDPAEEGLPGTFLGLPIALNLAVGESF